VHTYFSGVASVKKLRAQLLEIARERKGGKKKEVQKVEGNCLSEGRSTLKNPKPSINMGGLNVKNNPSQKR